MHRRRFLAAVSAFSAAAAGCTSAQRVEVHEVWTGRSFTSLYAGAHYNAYTVTGDGPVFVFALVGDGDSPSLLLDGKSHEPADELPGSTGADAVFSQRNTDDRRVVSFELPKPVDATSGSVGDAALDAEQLSFLSDPPEFSVTNVAVPESVPSGGHATVTVTVENSGGSPGRFRAAATSESISAWGPESLTVQPDTNGRLELSVPIRKENEERVNYTWGSGGGDRTVQVER